MVLKELVDGTLERDFTKATRVPLELIAYKGFFKYQLLDCSMNRDVRKRACLIGTFIQHWTHFWSDSLRLFLDMGVQNCTPGHYF